MVIVLDTPSSRLVIFILLILLMVPSILCSVFIFYHFIRSRELRQRINNQGVLLLLILSFVQVTSELPFSLIFLYKGSAAHASDGFCRLWIVLNYILVCSAVWTMTFLSIQRYWLVFHRAFFDRHQLLLHFIPMACCVVYPTTLYVCLVTVYVCQNPFDYSQWTCGGACYLSQAFLGTFDWMLNGCFDSLLSMLAALIIIIRVLGQKCRVTSQRSVWSRSRRIIIQLISLSILYTIVWVPCVICSVITIFTPIPFVSALNSAYLSYYQYLASLLCPLVCLFGLPEIRTKLRIVRKILPQVLTTTTKDPLQRLETQLN